MAHVYVCRLNRTVWLKDRDNWRCGLCKDELMLCRGCSNMSSMYPDCFGSCGYPMLLCPNCVTLNGPEECRYFTDRDTTYYLFDTEYKDDKRAWNEVEVNEGNLSFMTFRPGNVINVKKFPYKFFPTKDCYDDEPENDEENDEEKDNN
jgi:hypothetical protein